MKKYFMLIVAVTATSLIFWSCGSDDSTTEPTNQSPTCTIASPAPYTGFFNGDTISVKISVDDPDGHIKEVRYFLNGLVEYSTQTYPYSAEILTSDLPLGGNLIKVVVEDDDGAKTEVELPFGIKPQSATNLLIAQNNVHTFTLNWTYDLVGVDGFKIERKIDEAEFFEVGTTTDKTYIDSTLAKLTYESVYYRIMAFKDIYNSDPLENNYLISFPAPSNLAFTKENINTIILNWNDNSTGEDGFKMDKKIGDADWVLEFASVSENIKTWTDNSAEINQNIIYRVYAYKGANTSGTAQTSLINNSIPAPSNFSAPQTSITSSVLSWTDNSLGEDKFVIERKLSTETEYSILAEISGSNTSTKNWTDTTVPNLIYDYRIRTGFDTFYSAYALKTLNNLFPAPTNLAATQISIISANLTWTDSSIGEEKFEIERKLSTETTYVKIAEVSGNDTVTKTYNDNALEPAKTYDYRVKAVKELYSSIYAIKSAYETLPAPSALVACAESDTSIKLDWTDNSTGEDGFKIDRKTGDTGTWVTVFATVGANIKDFTDTDLAAGTTYYYRVRAFYSTYYSNYTSEVNAVPPVPVGFISIPTGSFSMGRSSAWVDEQPIHIVNISRAFYMGKYEVTQKEWTNIMGSNPASGYGVGDNYPVYYVSWYSILVYCNKRSFAEGLAPCYTISGSTNPTDWGSIPTSSNSTWNAVTCNFSAKGYRLPTEAEWEYTAQYNDGRMYPWGDTAPSSTICNYNNNVMAATVVGSYPTGNSNLGLCDMAGNVWELVWDWYGTYPSSTETDPDGPDTVQTYRVLRGGNWIGWDDYMRCADRDYFFPYGDSGDFAIGFRIARTQ